MLATANAAFGAVRARYQTPKARRRRRDDPIHCNQRVTASVRRL